MAVEVLNSGVLVLNNLWQVVDVCSAKRALCLLYLRHAQVVLKEGGSLYTFGFEDWKDFSWRLIVEYVNLLLNRPISILFA